MPIFDSGTATFFHQTSAPTGWTKDTTNYNDHAIRVVIGAVSSGGFVNFSAGFTTTPFTNVIVPMGSFGATTVSIPNLPPHLHGRDSPTGAYFFGGPQSPGVLATPAGGQLTASQWANQQTTPSGWGTGSHTHSVYVTANGDLGDLRIKYIDVIRCTKD